MMLQGAVGPQTLTDSSNPANARLGRNGDLIVSELHGKLYESTSRSNRFGFNGVATTTTAAGNATFTGTLIGNPAGSGYNLALGKVFISQVAALTAGTAIGIMYGPSTASITASLTTIFNRKAGGAASAMVATAGQTITAPTAFVVMGGSGSGAITVPGIIPAVGYDFEGGLVIPPGYFVASYTSVASTTALIWQFAWEEVPV